MSTQAISRWRAKVQDSLSKSYYPKIFDCSRVIYIFVVFPVLRFFKKEFDIQKSSSFFTLLRYWFLKNFHRVFFNPTFHGVSNSVSPMKVASEPPPPQKSRKE